MMPAPCLSCPKCGAHFPNPDGVDLALSSCFLCCVCGSAIMVEPDKALRALSDEEIARLPDDDVMLLAALQRAYQADAAERVKH